MDGSESESGSSSELPSKSLFSPNVGYSSSKTSSSGSVMLSSKSLKNDGSKAGSPSAVSDSGST